MKTRKMHLVILGFFTLIEADPDFLPYDKEDAGLKRFEKNVCDGIICYRCFLYYNKKTVVYLGSERFTEKRVLCLHWNKEKPTQLAKHFPDASVDHAKNFCRDPTGVGQPWCYVAYPKHMWKKCRIPICQDGLDYGWTKWVLIPAVCSVTCGKGTLKTEYKRTCIKPPPLKKSCKGESVNSTTKECDTKTVCPEPGFPTLYKVLIGLGAAVVFVIVMVICINCWNRFRTPKTSYVTQKFGRRRHGRHSSTHRHGAARGHGRGRH